MMNIYVIIVTYNGMTNNWIDQCLKSLQTSLIPINIVIVDNQSQDDTVAFVRQYYPEVVILLTNENLGFGRANNMGIKHGLAQNAAYFFLLNQDAEIFPDTIQELVTIHKKNTEYGIISPTHLNGKGDKLDKDFEIFAGAEYCKDLFSDFYLQKNTSKVYETKFVNAAAWLISEECIKKVGVFEPLIYHYGEDNNYCHRAVYNKVKIGIYPKVSILHNRNEDHNSHIDIVKASVRDNVVYLLDPLDHQIRNNVELKLRIKKFLALLRGDKKGHQIHQQTLSFYQINKKTIASHIQQIKEGKEYLFV